MRADMIHREESVRSREGLNSTQERVGLTEKIPMKSWYTEKRIAVLRRSLETADTHTLPDVFL